MYHNFLNNNQAKLRKLTKFRIPISLRPPKVINPKKEYNKRQNKDLIEQQLQEYEWEEDEKRLTVYDEEF